MEEDLFGGFSNENNGALVGSHALTCGSYVGLRLVSGRRPPTDRALLDPPPIHDSETESGRGVWVRKCQPSQGS